MGQIQRATPKKGLWPDLAFFRPEYVISDQFPWVNDQAEFGQTGKIEVVVTYYGSDYLISKCLNRTF